MIYKKVKLGDCCEIVSGSTPKTGTKDFWDGEILWVTPKDLSNLDSKYISGTPKKITEKGYKSCSTKILPPYSVLFSSRAPIGHVAINTVEMCTNQGFKSLIPDQNKLIPDYLYFWLKSHKDFLQSLGNGATFKEISKTIMENVEIPLPSVEDQKRIVEELDEADLMRKKRKKAVTLLDDYLKAVFLEMFGDPVANPKGWETKTIEQIAKNEKYSIKRGPFGGALKKEIFVNAGYLVYEQFHALNNDFSMARYFIDEEKFKELKAFEVKAGDIIISCSGVYLSKLAIVPPNSRKGIINQALLKVSLNEGMMKNILFTHIFSNENFKNKFFGKKIGSGIPNFPPMTTFKKFEFICPPIELQQEFETIVHKIEALKQSMLTQSKGLDTNFNALMQGAFVK